MKMKDVRSPLPPSPSKLLDQIRLLIRRQQMSYNTEKLYIYWIRKFILFHNKRHPKDMGAIEVTAFLNHLAEQKHVAPNTQRTALNAIVYLYRKFLQLPLDGVEFIRSNKTKRPPTVFTHDEAMRVINLVQQGVYQLMVKLLYGSGLRLNECLRLRVKDIDFGHLQITVRAGKGCKDRTTILPEELVYELRHQIQQVKQLHAYSGVWGGLYAFCACQEVPFRRQEPGLAVFVSLWEYLNGPSQWNPAPASYL